mmetsp:Transcript_5223/g.16579  ORF Transcript_5223/g.16579 Transcript_5223/m.16579 type:complete len:217 (+) Transcript_5223:790-1440(+)
MSCFTSVSGRSMHESMSADASFVFDSVAGGRGAPSLPPPSSAASALLVVFALPSEAARMRSRRIFATTCCMSTKTASSMNPRTSPRVKPMKGSYEYHDIAWCTLYAKTSGATPRSAASSERNFDMNMSHGAPGFTPCRAIHRARTSVCTSSRPYWRFGTLPTPLRYPGTVESRPSFGNHLARIAGARCSVCRWYDGARSGCDASVCPAGSATWSSR